MDTAGELDRRIEQMVADSKIDDYIRECLRHIETPDDLVHFFRRFTLYNQPFPGGVTILAGMFHLRPDLFVDKDEPIKDNADRSSVIASHIFFAAEDEFAGPNRLIRSTHRSMAQEMLREAMEYAGWTPQRLNDQVGSDAEYRAMADALRRGYRVGIIDDDRELFLALGFHLGSERLADIEFNALNDRLRDKFPTFVESAQNNKTEHGTPVYMWVEAHTSVEVDHYNYAVRGAGQAIDMYAGADMDRDTMFGLILDGFSEFIHFQRTMFNMLNQASPA